MRAILCAFLIAMSLAGADNSVTYSEAQDGWILLFDGETFFGWTQDGRGRWKVSNGTVSFDGSDSGLLRTNTVFSDYILRLDFRVADPNIDSGLFLRIAREGVPRETGYDVRLGDSDSKWPAGSVAQVFKGDGKLPPNTWHSLEAELSGDQISVKIDGRKIGEAKDGKSKAGFIQIVCNKGSTADFKNIKLKPTASQLLFNGSDLSGWKESAAPPPKKGGFIKKIDPFAKGGKPKETQWTVANGLIHGAGGPGQLESQAPYDDFLLQYDVRINSKSPKEHLKGGVLVRADPGQLGSGYEVQTENTATGGIAGLRPPRKVLGNDNEFVTETVAARGRHFEIWVNGYPVTEYDDTRAEGASPKRDARTAAGPIALFAPEKAASLDYRAVKIAALPKTLGGHPGAVAAAAPLPSATPPAPVIPSAVPGAPPSAAPAAAPPAISFVNPNQAKEDANKAQVTKLMDQALQTSDPSQQLQLYKNILSVDPNNVNAAQGYREAQQKIDQANAQQQKAAADQAQRSQAEATKSAKLEESMQKGEAAFLAGDLASAASWLAMARQIAPSDPRVGSLGSRVDSAMQARERIRYLLFGGGILVLLGGVGGLFLMRGKKDPYLEVVDGLEKGRRYNVDREVIHIGAVAQDGGSKNDIVLRDPERLISRFHCEIHSKNGKLFLVDLNSSNGTFLDKKKISPGRPIRIKRGSRIGIGSGCTLRTGFEKRQQA